MIYVIAGVARKRRERGLKRNYPEAVAIPTGEILEWAREGRDFGDSQATFPDGPRLVTVRIPSNKS